MIEEYKQIINYPNYSISNFGNVKNNKSGRILKQHIRNSGYYFISLHFNIYSKKSISTHRLIGEYFLQNFDPKLQIDHIDRNKLNNHISNLRCVTRGENSRNQNKREDCSSKYKGVYLNKTTGKWVTSVYRNKKTFNLGSFHTEEDAYKKVLEWNSENGFL